MTLEASLEELKRSFAERTIADRPAIRLNEVIAAPLPKAIPVYLQAEVLRSLELDLRSGSTLRHIDRTSPGMQQLIASFARSLSYAYTFDREAYLQALDDAVHFAANYLFRPRWTLEQFLFEEQPAVSLATIESRLASVTDYTYLGEILLRILRRRGVSEVSVDDVRNLLARIDDQVVQQHSPKELASLTRPIFSFMLQGDDAADRPIPVEPLLLFFEDKKMGFLRDYLEGIVGIRKASGLSLNELTTLIEDLYSAESREVVPPAPDAAGHVEPAPPDLEQTPPEPFPPLAEAEVARNDEGAEPSPEEPASEPPVGEPARELPVEETEEPPPATDDAAPPVNPALSLTFAGMMESRPVRLPKFETIVTDQQRKRFVKKVFHRDADFYQTVIAALEEMTDWEQAATYLKEFYRTNGLDPFAGDVVEFTDTIQRRFQRGAR